MKARLRPIAKKALLSVIGVIGVSVGVLCLPRDVEGVYSAGQLIQCLCDSSHYLRFHNGWVVHYSTNHEPANLLGRYKLRPDGGVVAYMTPLRKTDPEVLLFTLQRPRIGFVIASAPDEDQAHVLVRLPATGKRADLFARQNVTQVTIPEESLMVTTFYDSSLARLREETKPIKPRKEEQAPPEPPLPAVPVQ